MNYANTHCIVVGLGETGLSCAKWLARQGARVTVADSRSAPPNLVQIQTDLPQVALRLGAFNSETFADADLLVMSPGVALATPEVAAAVARGVPVAGDVELFAQALSEVYGSAGLATEADAVQGGRSAGTGMYMPVHEDSEHRPTQQCAVAGAKPKVIAITGANGKSTVTTMVGAMCEAAGLQTEVAGNIGLPVLDALSNWQDKGALPDVWVLELSSFQLETTSSLDADAATVLNVSEDHLDRYAGSMDLYAAAKARIFAGSGVQVLNREDAYCRAMALAGRQSVWFGLDAPRAADEYGLVDIDGDFSLRCGEQEILRASQLPLAGLHNAANALSALALCRAIGLDWQPLVQALQAFKGLPHRVEFVAEINGVRYYDDSKGTNVGATEAALKGMTQPVVLIAGGDGKGQDFTPLQAACERICRAVLLIGRDAPKIAEVLNEATSPYLHSDDEDENFLPVLQVPTLEMAVQMAASFAEPGDVVLLSPACASLDMFRNYGHRAQVFIDSVKGLQP